MFPILLKVGPFTFYTYGLLVATGFLAGVALITYQAKKEGVDPQKAMDLSFYALAAAILGSRILYIIVNYDVFIESPLRVFKIWEGGLVFYGGFIGAALAGFWYVRKEKLDTWHMADLAAPSIALGHAIGRWGCLASGSCYGKPTSSWFGITFTDVHAIAPLGIPLFPSQIVESIMEFSIFLLLIAVRPHRKFKGQLFIMWLLLYAVGRFILEFFRGDDRGFIIPNVLSTSQGVAVVVFVAGLFLLRRLARAGPASAGR
ncbi:MAG: prolipoprotein diacylglyceryl transferase [Nitrospinota bacterium]